MNDSASTDRRALEIPVWKKVMHALGIYLVVIALLPIAWFFDHSFFTATNFNNMFTGMQHLLIVVLGASFITYSGKMADLSIPFTMVASAFAAVFFLPYGLPVAFLATAVTGVLVGTVNGLAIGYLNLNPIIWTFAMNFILEGVIRLFFQGRQVYPEGAGAEAFLAVANYRVLGFIPPVIFVAIVLGAILHVVMKKSNFGRDVQLTGSSEEVALATGVKVPGLILKVFVISGLCTAFAGLTKASSLTTANYNLGLGMDFDAVTAIVLGGISLQGGKGFLTGAVGGLLVVTIIQTTMSAIPGVSIYWQDIVKASIFISVVAINTHLSRKAGRS